MTTAELMSSLANVGYTVSGDPVIQESWGDGTWSKAVLWAYKQSGKKIQGRWIHIIKKNDNSEAYFEGDEDPTEESGAIALKNWLNARIADETIDGYVIDDIDTENETAIVRVYREVSGDLKELRFFVNRTGGSLQYREIT